MKRQPRDLFKELVRAARVCAQSIRRSKRVGATHRRALLAALTELTDFPPRSTLRTQRTEAIARFLTAYRTALFRCMDRAPHKWRVLADAAEALSSAYHADRFARSSIRTWFYPG